MPEMEFNERKFQFFSIIKEQRSITSTNLAQCVNLTVTQTACLLKHYYDFRYLRRYRIRLGIYRYYLTKKGHRVLSKLKRLHEAGQPLKITR
jgi:hypothetical protein